MLSLVKWEPSKDFQESVNHGGSRVESDYLAPSSKAHQYIKCACK